MTLPLHRTTFGIIINHTGNQPGEDAGTLTQIVIPTRIVGEESAGCAYRKKQISRRIPSASPPTDVPGEDAGRSGSGNPVGVPVACYAPCLDLIVI